MNSHHLPAISPLFEGVEHILSFASMKIQPAATMIPLLEEKGNQTGGEKFPMFNPGEIQ